MSRPLPVRVAGVGSPQGDDAAGWEVVRKLRDRAVSGEDVEFHEVDGGQRLLDLLDGTGTLLLIDALAPAGSPGAIQRFDWTDKRIEVLRPGSTHSLGPAEALHLAETLGVLPSRVVVFGIEAANLELRPELSPPVAAAVSQLVCWIAKELAEDS